MALYFSIESRRLPVRLSAAFPIKKREANARRLEPGLCSLNVEFDDRGTTPRILADVVERLLPGEGTIWAALLGQWRAREPDSVGFHEAAQTSGGLSVGSMDRSVGPLLEARTAERSFFWRQTVGALFPHGTWMKELEARSREFPPDGLVWATASESGIFASLEDGRSSVEVVGTWAAVRSCERGLDAWVRDHE